MYANKRLLVVNHTQMFTLIQFSCSTIKCWSSWKRETTTNLWHWMSYDDDELIYIFCYLNNWKGLRAHPHAISITNVCHALPFVRIKPLVLCREFAVKIISMLLSALLHRYPVFVSYFSAHLITETVSAHGKYGLNGKQTALKIHTNINPLLVILLLCLFFYLFIFAFL